MKNIIYYNKLVRDRIPGIIETSGKTCVTETLSDADYLLMLDKKLDEELVEYHQDQNIEELADLLEVIYAVAKARGYPGSAHREGTHDRGAARDLHGTISKHFARRFLPDAVSRKLNS